MYHKLSGYLSIMVHNTHAALVIIPHLLSGMGFRAKETFRGLKSQNQRLIERWFCVFLTQCLEQVRCPYCMSLRTKKKGIVLHNH